MTNNAVVTSPQSYARIGGMLYLFIIIAASFGEMVARNSLIVWRDAAATAANIMGSETLFRLGIAGEMLTCVCDITLAMILYVLLKPINRNVALLGAFFRVAFISIYGVTKLFEIMTLVVLGDANYLKAFDPQQLNALALISLRVHSYGYGASLLFFGVCSALFGYLIYKSEYLPRSIGALLAFAGVGYVIFSLTQIVAPAFAARILFNPTIAVAFFAELGVALWLLIKGVNMPKWHEITNT